MKQRAVDWLQQALEDTILDHEQIMQTIGLFEQAKEMEQEQMIDWYATGQADTVNMYEQHLKKPSNTKREMKTPMQELIEWVRNYPGQTGKSSVIAKATELFEKEKEMLAGVWLDAQVAYQGDEYIKPSDPTFNEYYEETFNTKEK